MKKQTVLLVLAFLPLISFSQWTSNVAVNTPVFDSSGVAETTPLIATTADGSTYVSWFEPSAGTNYQLRMQRIDVNGVLQWGSSGITVSSFPQNTALFRYDLAVDQEDNAIVAFQDERSGQLDIVAYKLNPSGVMLWGNSGIALTDTGSTQGLAPAIGITSANNVIIAWNANATNKWIAIQKISASGTIVWPAVKRIIGTTLNYSRPTMVASGADDFSILYVEESGTGFPPVSKMYAQRFDATGTSLWSQPLLISSKTIPFFYFPKAVSDRNDGFYISFNTSLNSNPSLGDVYVQRVRGNGSFGLHHFSKI
jgi:hypothetical protein